MAFVKTTPGYACKAAEAFGARWVWPSVNSSVQEARDADDCAIAYRDSDGFFVHASIAKLDLSDIAA